MRKISIILLVTIFIFLYGCMPNESITVSFETNGGSLIEDIIIDSSLNFVLPDNPIKEGYTFLGWYLDNETFEVEYSNILLTNSLTLYAKWIEEEIVYELAIFFESNGGSIVNPIVEDEGEDISEPIAPTREGYEFAGWYSDIELTEVYEFNVMPAESITLYADWGTVGLEYELINSDTEYSVSKGTSSLLTEIQIPNRKDGFKVTQIKNQGFIECQNLEKIIIPKTIVLIPEASFRGCGKLSEITLPFTGARRDATGSEGLFGYIFGKLPYEGGKWTRQTFFVDSLVSFNPKFEQPSLEKLAIEWPSVLPETQTYYIPNSLISISITDETMIKSGAFSYIESLKSLNLNEGITDIWHYAFKLCEEVEKIIIPKSVINIYSEAFAGVKGEIFFQEDSKLEEIKREVFQAYFGKNIKIPSSVKIIEVYAFRFCIYLETVFIPDSVEEIETRAFNQNDILNIYVENSDKPSGWDSWWNYDNRPVIWGYTGE